MNLYKLCFGSLEVLRAIISQQESMEQVSITPNPTYLTLIFINTFSREFPQV